MESLYIILAFLALVFGESYSDASCSRPDEIEWNGLHATWLPTATPKKNAFYKLPRTMDDATQNGWVEVECANDLKVSVYCLPNDPRVCILLDARGFIAGLQISIPVRDVADIQDVYDMSKINMFRRKTMFKVDVWSSTFYMVSPEIIQAGGRKEMNELTGTDGVWLDTTDGYLVIPKYVSELDPIWKRETCIDRMGTHFYFNTSATQLCSTIRPLFLMSNKEQIVSVGWFTFGGTTLQHRPWVEQMPLQLIKLINPAGPLCLYDGIKQYGLLSIHIYFVEEPWNISC